jgi:hypothetical protein
MAEEVIQGWEYDRILADDQATIATANLGTTKRVPRRLSHGLAAVPGSRLERILAKGAPATHFPDPLVDFFHLQRALAVQSVRRMRDAIPIVIGPATLDSLVHKRPETYEYVRAGQLPFPNMFFEFQEPIALPLPFTDRVREAVGMEFCRSTPDLVPLLGAEIENPTQVEQAGIDASEDLRNFHSAYYARVAFPTRDGGFEYLHLHFDPATQGAFLGQSWPWRFAVNIRKKTVAYKNVGADPMIEQERRLYTHNVPLAECKNHHAFRLVANLCTNIVNYINAQNVTVERRNRDVRVTRTDRHDRSTTVDLKRPYYIVRIEPRTVVEGERHAGGGKWELNWRVYVRGHNRTYREPDGSERETIWIDPYVKGPEGAPWRHHRYELLNAKLERERLMLP